jgi:hypothetical protein
VTHPAQPFVDTLKAKALGVLERKGPEAAIDTFVTGLKKHEATRYRGVIAQASDPTFEEHWRGGNDEHTENELVALWINDFTLGEP